MQMTGTLRPGAGRVAKIKVTIIASNIPQGAEARVADVMFQPGGSVSGWMPHVTELPWSAGVVSP